MRFPEAGHAVGVNENEIPFEAKLTIIAMQKPKDKAMDESECASE